MNLEASNIGHLYYNKFLVNLESTQLAISLCQGLALFVFDKINIAPLGRYAGVDRRGLTPISDLVMCLLFDLRDNIVRAGCSAMAVVHIRT